MDECRYELKKPFQYAYKGEMEEANFITLSAPNFTQFEKVTPIKQAIAAALKERFEGIDTAEIEEAQEIAASQQDTEDDSGIDASFVMAALFTWSGNLTKVFKNAEALFLSGVALVDGETKATKNLIEKMSLDDFEGMLGAYLANFIIPSLMDGQ